MRMRFVSLLATALAASLAHAQNGLLWLGSDAKKPPMEVFDVRFGSIVPLVEQTSGNFRTYQPGAVRWGSISFAKQLGEPDDCDDLIAAIFNPKEYNVTGIIAVGSADGSTNQWPLLRARPTRLSLPACRSIGGFSEVSGLGIELAVMESSDQPGTVDAPIGNRRQKMWVPANFRVDIDGYENHFGGTVEEVESIVVRQVADIGDLDGDGLGDYTVEPFSMRFRLPTGEAQEGALKELHASLGKRKSVSVIFYGRDKEVARVLSFGAYPVKIVIDRDSGRAKVTWSITDRPTWSTTGGK